MTTTKTDTHQPHLVLTATPAKPLRYPFHLRVNDVVAGFRDGLLGLAETTAYSQTSTDPARADDIMLPTWLRNNAHQFAERAGREYLVAHHDARPKLEEIRASAAEIPSLETIRDAAAQELHALEASLDESALRRRLPSESKLDVAAVAVRRQREHDLLVADARQRLVVAESAVKNAVQIVARSRSHVVTRYEHLVGRVVVLREFHNRRATAFKRSFVRRWRRTNGESGTVGLAALDEYRIDAPEWCTPECPWLESTEYSGVRDDPTAPNRG